MSVLFEQPLSLAGHESRALELEGDGPPLLLLHGWGDSADTWRPLLDRLNRLGQRAVAVDMPGYGSATPLRRSEPVLPQLDQFVAAVVERFAPDGGAFVAGNSLGGCAALRAAENDQLGLAGIVPIAPAGFDMAGWFLIVESERLVRMLLAAPVPLPRFIVRQAVGQVYRGLAFAHPRQVDGRVVSSFTNHISSRADVARVLASGRRLRGELSDCFNLERITCPVLLVWGDSDRMVFASGAERVLRGVPDSRIEVIEDCGHCPQIEAAGRLADLLVDFCLVEAPAKA